MVALRRFLKVAAIVAAATIGSGVFALPYVVARTGWLLVIFYFIAFATVISAAHVIYLKTLESVGEKERLLGLARKYFGAVSFWAGFIAIVIGLLLTFTAYLILGPQFVLLIFPAIAPAVALAIFWFIIAVPVFLGDKSAVNLEELGIFLVSAVIIFIFASGHPLRAFSNFPPINFHYFFLPLGVILFSLAGWTSIEPVYGASSGKNGKIKSGANIWIALVAGTVFAAVLYFLFTVGILGSASRIAADTLSGLMNWPFWERDIVVVVGLFAIWTASVPLSRELRNALERDLEWNPLLTRCAIVGVPLAAVLLGFNNFLAIVSLTGGLFLSTQYLLIISVGSRALAFSRTKKIFLIAAASVFIFAAVYSVYSFLNLS
jgi:amino acid permease